MTAMLDDRSAAALALTSRLVDSPVRPLSPREYWKLTDTTDPENLLGKSASEIAGAVGCTIEAAERLATLMERGTSLAIALEKLDHSGIWTLTHNSPNYPSRLINRLGQAAPVVLHGAGDQSLLSPESVGLVGSRNVSPEGSQVAKQIAQTAADLGFGVVSGAARGVDQAAMNAAFDAGGRVIGVLADSLVTTTERQSLRKGISSGRICVMTPFGPNSGFSVGNAMGRNKLIYGLATVTVVVASEATGGTWNGATEALKHSYGRVAVWQGPGEGIANADLITLGATPLSDVTQINVLLGQPYTPSVSRAQGGEDGQQLSFGL